MVKNFEGNTGRVFKYLKSHKGITSMEAFELFGVTRLSAIIFNLRKAGYEIDNKPKACRNRYGEKVHFVEYRMVKDKK